MCQYRCRTLVELEVLSEETLTEPDSSVSIQQSFVIVVSDPASILDLAHHVAYSRP